MLSHKTIAEASPKPKHSALDCTLTEDATEDVTEDVTEEDVEVAEMQLEVVVARSTQPAEDPTEAPKHIKTATSGSNGRRWKLVVVATIVAVAVLVVVMSAVLTTRDDDHPDTAGPKEAEAAVAREADTDVPEEPNTDVPGETDTDAPGETDTDVPTVAPTEPTCPASPYKASGTKCSSEGQQCTYGNECCCGECSYNFQCSCFEGLYECGFSDFCFGIMRDENGNEICGTDVPEGPDTDAPKEPDTDAPIPTNVSTTVDATPFTVVYESTMGPATEPQTELAASKTCQYMNSALGDGMIYNSDVKMTDYLCTHSAVDDGSPLKIGFEISATFEMWECTTTNPTRCINQELPTQGVVDDMISRVVSGQITCAPFCWPLLEDFKYTITEGPYSTVTGFSLD